MDVLCLVPVENALFNAPRLPASLLGGDKNRRGQGERKGRKLGTSHSNGLHISNYEKLRIFIFNNSQIGSKSLGLDVITCAPIFLANTVINISFDLLDAGHFNCDKTSPALTKSFNHGFTILLCLINGFIVDRIVFLECLSLAPANNSIITIDGM